MKEIKKNCCIHTKPSEQKTYCIAFYISPLEGLGNAGSNGGKNE